MASLAPARAEIEAGTVAKADQYILGLYDLILFHHCPNPVQSDIISALSPSLHSLFYP